MKAFAIPILAVALVALVYLAFPASPVNESDWNTQVVAQWLTDTAEPGPDSLSMFQIAYQLDNACTGICVYDGHDIGRGTHNLFFYTDDVERTVNTLRALESNGTLPAGMRVGIARYRNEERTDWTYEPVHPEGLNHFDISYRQPERDSSQTQPSHD